MREPFLPSTHGFHFANDWPKVPDATFDVPLIGTIGLGDASQGLCGGMATLAADLYRSGVPVPTRKDNPPPGSPLFDRIVRRFLDSLDLPMGVLKAYAWMASGANLAARTWGHELADIVHSASTHGVVPITLIRVHSLNPLEGSHNHQVLVYDCRVTPNSVLFRVYDNNYPDDDDQTLLCTSDAVVSSGYDVVRGFYRNHYAPAAVVVPPEGW